MRLRWLVGLVCFMLLNGSAFSAEPAKTELHIIQTSTLTDEQFLTGAASGPPVTIVGELRLPRPGADRFPAMIIVHGSGGILASEDRWARELNDSGIATFLLDGFTPRGITSVGADQSQLGTLTMINDAYRALDVLAKHPRIDRSRIGILGLSRGGRVALYAALKRFQRLYAPDTVEFAVYVPFYAPCYTTYVDDTDVVERPIRLFHGVADDYVPVGPCRAYVERLRKTGKDVQLTEYADAHHGFDNPLSSVTRLPQSQTARGCELFESPVGRIVNRNTGLPFAWDDPCVQRGVTVGYNAQAHAQAIKDVKAMLGQVFKLDLSR